jgi:CRISPR system Cascade subunit CasE
MRDVDIGYLVHAQLGHVFGELAPKPFCIEEQGGAWTTVLGYGTVDARQLRDAALERLEGRLDGVLDVSALASKPLPDDWPAGLRLQFETRVAPVVRKSSADPSGRFRAGAEIDAFLAQVWATNDADVPLSREAAYAQWLSDEFARRGGATIDSATIRSYTRSRLVRRRQGDDRTSGVLDRPDVRFRGTLTVTNSEEFGALLTRGLGRHRAFGFGMIKLAPARGRG